MGKSTAHTAFSPGQGEFPDYQDFDNIQTFLMHCPSYMLQTKPNHGVQVNCEGRININNHTNYIIYQNTALQL